MAPFCCNRIRRAAATVFHRGFHANSFDANAWEVQVPEGILQTERVANYISVKFRDMSVVPSDLPNILL